MSSDSAAKPAFLLYNTTKPPYSTMALASQCAKIVGAKTVKIAFKASEKGTSVRVNGSEEVFFGEWMGSKFFARMLGEVGGDRIYGTNATESTQVDFFVALAEARIAASGANAVAFRDACVQLNTHLAARTYLVGNSITLGDYAVWSSLVAHSSWAAWVSAAKHTARDEVPHLVRWFEFIDATPSCREANPSKDEQAAKAKVKMDKSKEGGSFDIGLDKATMMGKVVTRFPPEPSGYMHMGHAKAALLNHHYARDYNGKLILRFDDTNPSKEKSEYEQSIMEDLASLGIQHDVFSHSSDHFETIQAYGDQLIASGKAYIDFTLVDQMRDERSKGIESKCRNHSIEENQRLWAEMKKASPEGLTCCMRAKIDMKSPNGCMRDPTMYRCNLTPHHKTGTTYKVYPTYDFTCPIVDSIEGVTHAMRTNEYHDRNEQYMWVLDALNLRKPAILDFSRLNFVYTTLSKRKLNWFVAENKVEGWTDPRFPTVRGVLRRGLTVAALKEFMLRQGFSNMTNNMEWDNIWATNKRIIDPTSHRYVAVANEAANGGAVPFVLSNFSGADSKQTPLLPKNPDAGTRELQLAARVLLERDDVKLLKEGEEITLMRWGNAIVERIEKDANGNAVAVHGRLNLEGDFSKTERKITFVAERADCTKLQFIELDHLVTKAKLSEEDKFEDYVTPVSRFATDAVADRALLQNVQVGQIVQFERRGYFICDQKPVDGPMQFIYIPDGRSQAMSTLSTKVQLKMA